MALFVPFLSLSSEQLRPLAKQVIPSGADQEDENDRNANDEARFQALRGKKRETDPKIKTSLSLLSLQSWWCFQRKKELAFHHLRSSSLFLRRSSKSLGSFFALSYAQDWWTLKLILTQIEGWPGEWKPETTFLFSAENGAVAFGRKAWDGNARSPSTDYPERLAPPSLSFF